MILRNRLGCSGTVLHQPLPMAWGVGGWGGGTRGTLCRAGLETPHGAPHLTNFKFLCGRQSTPTDAFLSQELKLWKGSHQKNRKLRKNRDVWESQITILGKVATSLWGEQRMHRKDIQEVCSLPPSPVCDPDDKHMPAPPSWWLLSERSSGRKHSHCFFHRSRLEECCVACAFSCQTT